MYYGKVSYAPTGAMRIDDDDDGKVSKLIYRYIKA